MNDRDNGKRESGNTAESALDDDDDDKYIYIVAVVVVVGDRSRGRPGGSFFNSYYTEL